MHNRETIQAEETDFESFYRCATPLDVRGFAKLPVTYPATIEFLDSNLKDAELSTLQLQS